METDDIIDYKAIVERLQHELEEARLTIVKMRFDSSPLDRLSAENIIGFLEENYMAIAAIGVIITVALNIISTIKTLRRNK